MVISRKSVSLLVLVTFLLISIHQVSATIYNSTRIQAGEFNHTLFAQNITIDSVNMNNSFVIVSTRSPASTANRLLVQAVLVNETVIEFTKYTTSDSMVSWQVIESPDIFVQRGIMQYTTTNTTMTRTLDETINMSNTFVILSSKLNTTTASQSVRGYWQSFLSTTTLNLTRGVTGTLGVASYQVISWNESLVSQRNISIPVGIYTANFTLPTAVNLTNTFITTTTKSTGTGTGQNLVRTSFFNNTLVKFDRYNATAGVTDVTYYIVTHPELRVQSGLTSIASSRLNANASITSINTSRTFLTRSFQQATHASVDARGYNTYELISSSIITFDRSLGTAQDTDIAWYAITFNQHDVVSPTINFQIGGTPLGGTIVNSSSLYISTLATDNLQYNSSIHWVYNITGLYISNISTAQLWQSNFTNTPDGFYYFNATATDKSGNMASTETRNVTIDTLVPLINFTSPTPIDGSTISQPDVLINVSVTDANFRNVTYFLYNATELIFSNFLTQTPFLINYSGLPDGIYFFNSTTIDAIGNTNRTETRNVTISTVVPSTSPPNVTSLTEFPSDPATYLPGQAYQFNATVKDSAAISAVKLEFAGINYTASNVSSVYSFTFLDLPAGTYSYRWFANNSLGYMNDTENGTYTINRAVPTCNINTNTPVMYPNAVNVSGNCTSPEANAVLWISNTNVTNPFYTVLKAGSYFFHINVSQTQNYTLVEANQTVVVQQNNTYNLTLSLSPADTVTYPTATTATGAGCPSELSCVLWRDNVIKSNPNAETLKAGSYVYVYNSTGNENYTVITLSKTLLINKATGNINTYVNGQQSSITINTGTTLEMNATLVVGMGTIFLYFNDSLINTGASPLYNATVLLNGLYNVTGYYSGNENYTSDFETWFVTVQFPSNFTGGGGSSPLCDFVYFSYYDLSLPSVRNKNCVGRDYFTYGEIEV